MNHLQSIKLLYVKGKKRKFVSYYLTLTSAYIVFK